MTKNRLLGSMHKAYQDFDFKKQRCRDTLGYLLTHADTLSPDLEDDFLDTLDKVLKSMAIPIARGYSPKQEG